MLRADLYGCWWMHLLQTKASSMILLALIASRARTGDSNEAAMAVECWPSVTLELTRELSTMAGQGFAIPSGERGMLTKTTLRRDQGSGGDMRTCD